MSDPRVEVEIARRTLVDGWQSFRKMPGGVWGVETIERGSDSIHDPWQTLPDRILAASPHIQGYDVPGEEIDRLKAQGLTLLEALEELGIS